MEKTQSYIGVRNGLVVCMDEYQGVECQGRYYHSYSKEAFPFSSPEDMLNQIQAFFDEMRYPFNGNKERSFGDSRNTYTGNKELKKVMKDKELLDKKGDLGTFIIRVQHRQNSSWQGRITWMEEDKTLSFRSIWEMMKLIDSAMEQYRDEDEEEMPKW